jgi:hypothetical protein
VLIEAALKLAAQDRDRIAAAKADDRASRPSTMLTSWKPATEPVEWVEKFRGVAFETYRSPATGRVEQRWTGKPVTFRMPIIGQEPIASVTLPKAWWVPQEQVEVIDRLRLHGIRFETIGEPLSLTLDRVRLHDPAVQRAQDGRLPLKASFTHEAVKRILPAGTIRVPSNQPLGLLAAALLEPEAADSFLAWGFFPEMLSAPANAEDFVRAPLGDALLAQNEAAKSAFDAKLKTDPSFKADPQARIDWLLGRFLEEDARHLTYPILRETSRETRNPSE